MFKYSNKVKIFLLICIALTSFSMFVAVHLHDEDYAQSEHCYRCWIKVTIDGDKYNRCLHNIEIGRQHGERYYTHYCGYCRAYYYYDYWEERNGNCIVSASNFGDMTVHAKCWKVHYFEEWDVCASIP